MGELLNLGQFPEGEQIGMMVKMVESGFDGRGMTMGVIGEMDGSLAACPNITVVQIENGDINQLKENGRTLDGVIVVEPVDMNDPATWEKVGSLSDLVNFGGRVVFPWVEVDGSKHLVVRTEYSPGWWYEQVAEEGLELVESER